MNVLNNNYRRYLIMFRLHDKSYLSSDCPSNMIIYDSIQRKLTHAEFLKLELEYEKQRKVDNND